MAEDPLTDWEIREVEQRKTLRSTLYELLGRNKHIARIEVEYDGHGDSGQIESISFFNSKKRLLKINNSKLLAAVDHYVFSLVPYGWENDAGGFGTIHIDALQQKTHVKHNVRFEDWETEEFED